MFDLDDVMKCISFLTYLGIIISCVSGLTELKSDVDVSSLLICIIVLLNTLVFSVFDIGFGMETECIIYKNDYNYYIRGTYLIISSLLIVGVSKVGLGFGIFGTIIGFINIICGLLIPTSKTYPLYNSQNSQNSHNSHNSQCVDEYPFSKTSKSSFPTNVNSGHLSHSDIYSRNSSHSNDSIKSTSSIPHTRSSPQLNIEWVNILLPVFNYI